MKDQLPPRTTPARGGPNGQAWAADAAQATANTPGGPSHFLQNKELHSL